MSAPLTPPWPVRVEVALDARPGDGIADWTWTDITPWCFTAASPSPVDITYGRQDGVSDTGPSSMQTVLDNRDGRFTPYNGGSPYWPYWRRGLPIRVRLDGLGLVGLSLAGEVWTTTTGSVNGWAETPHDASLNTTDLDVRVDLTPSTWRNPTTETIAGKYAFNPAGSGAVVDQRGWALAITNGVPEVYWSTDGTFATRIIVPATAAVPADAGRVTLRATLDADNGAGGHTLTFYTGASLDGPWTPLGEPVVQAGTTTVFASTVALEVGAVNTGTSVNTGTETFTGMVYRFQQRAGIDSPTIVADPHFAAVNPGASAFTDAAGRPWAVSARITDPSVRYCGQLVEIAPTWPYGDLSRPSGDDPLGEPPGESLVAITAAGTLRRLNQGASPLRSAFYRGITDIDLTRPLAYWPCEDGKDATQLAEAYGRAPMSYSGDVTLAAQATACSDAVPTFKLGNAIGNIAPVASTGYLRLMALTLWPDELQNDSRVLYMDHIGGGGTVGRWEVWTHADSSIRVFAYNTTGGQILASGTIGFSLLGEDGALWLELTQEGGNIRWGISFAATPSNTQGGFSDVLAGHTLGSARRVIVGNIADLSGMAVGHVTVYNSPPATQVLDALRAYNGERAADRMDRVLAEEGAPFWMSMPGSTTSEQMGPQHIDTLPNLVQEAARADHGILTETLDTLGLHYRARADMYYQDPAIALDASAGWGQITAPFDPVDDDQDIRNIVDVSREDGSIAHVEDALHVAEYGRYEDSVTVNVERDDQLVDIAGWRLHLGTWPGMRYPAISPAIDQHPELAADWLRIRPGDIVRVTGLPRQHRAGPVDLLVQGWSESISPHFWSATANTTAGAPWDIAIAAPPDSPDMDRVDTAGSLTVNAVPAGATTVYIATLDGPRWTEEAGELPLPLRIDGEDVQVTAVTPALADDFLDRTVSDGWGTSTSGTPWATIVGGVAADYSVHDEFGYIAHSTRATRMVLSGLDVNQTHLNLHAAARADVLPAGGVFTNGVVIRYVDPGTFVYARVVLGASGTASLQILRRDGGAETALATSPSMPVAVSDYLNIRLHAVGPTLRARFWKRTDPEPSHWTLTATDPAPRPGQFGVISQLDANTTNPLPVTMEWWEVVLDSPQHLTIPAPGLQWPHSAGRDVRLTTPAIVAW